MAAKKKILFIAGAPSTFVKHDLNILKKYFKVKTVFGQDKGRMGSIFEIAKNIYWCDVSYTWFASLNGMIAIILSKIFRKKSILVTGGWDIAKVPEIKYGKFAKFPLESMITLNLADIVLPISKSSQRELLKRVKTKKNRMVYCGVPLNKFYPGERKKENIVLTVGVVRRSNVKRKGIKYFADSAKYLPNVEFVVIGKFMDKSIEYLKSIAPKNVSFKGYVSEKELLNWYQRSKIYAQLSAHEGFGLSVAEAMLCGCIPVVTKRFALPEVVGDAGYYAPYADPKKTAEVIKRVLNSSDDLGNRARIRIIDNFSLEKREKELLEIFKNL